MNVSLTPTLAKLVDERVASGRYGSASEVVREALRLLEERDGLRKARLRELRKALDVGLAQLDRGERVLFDHTTTRRIKTEGRKLLTERKRRA
jgi:antitoxin ParD1/3/4